MQDLAPDSADIDGPTPDADAPAGKFETEDGPERTCIVTRIKGSPSDMIRFVLGPDLAVIPDIRHKLPGRGVWVTARAAKVAEAVKRQAFARGFKVKAVASSSLPDELDALLRQDCLQFLSLVNKAGLLIAGFAKVEAAVESDHITGLLHASDAGNDGVRKLLQTLRRRFGEGRLPPQIKLFAGDELDLALGRTNVIHAALLAGPASEAFVTRCRRLMAYRSEMPLGESGHVFASSEELAGLDEHRLAGS
jgi:predicted RNA-binding protein YlxR (DUF448 family)